MNKARIVLGSIVLAVLSSWAAAGDKAVEIRKCRQVVVQVEDPGERSTGERVAEIVCAKAMRLAPMFGLTKGQLVLVRIAADQLSFTRLTGKSFYTVAVFMTRGIGDMIITQPAARLHEFDKLEGVLTHELIHLMIRRSVGRRCPTWLNEGLAQWYEGRRNPGPMPEDEDELEALERRWRSPDTPVASRRRDYRASVALVGLLMDRVGEKALLAAVRKLRRTSRPLDLDIEGRSMRMWLFRDRDQDDGVTELPLEQMLMQQKEKK